MAITRIIDRGYDRSPEFETIPELAECYVCENEFDIDEMTFDNDKQQYICTGCSIHSKL